MAFASKVFGFLFGFGVLLYGVMQIIYRGENITPCNKNCGMEQALKTYLGDYYPFFSGGVWILLGIALIVIVAIRSRESG